MSRSNFLRQLPQTWRQLEQLGFVNMQRHVKVGGMQFVKHSQSFKILYINLKRKIVKQNFSHFIDNTYPNVLAMLTGKRAVKTTVCKCTNGAKCIQTSTQNRNLTPSLMIAGIFGLTNFRSYGATFRSTIMQRFSPRIGLTWRRSIIWANCAAFGAPQPIIIFGRFGSRSTRIRSSIAAAQSAAMTPQRCIGLCSIICARFLKRMKRKESLRFGGRRFVFVLLLGKMLVTSFLSFSES